MLQYRLKGLRDRMTGRQGRTRVDAGNVPPPHIEVTPEAVTWAYRMFLGRDPESQETVDEKMRSFSALSDLRECLLTSPEYLANNPPMHVPSISGHEPAMEVEEVESSEDLAKILEHIRLTWQFLGETEPHWSVSTSRKFLSSHQRNRGRFLQLGRDHVEKLLGLVAAERARPLGVPDLRRIWMRPWADHPLARRLLRARLLLRHLGGHLGVLHHLTRSGVTNVTLRHVRTVDEMVNLERVDLVYSLIVLQTTRRPSFA